MLPSQVISEAVAAGEIKKKNTFQRAGTDTGTDQAMPPPPPALEMKPADTTSDSDDDDDEYSSDEEAEATDGEEEEKKDDREPGFANVDKALPGPDMLMLSAGAGAGTSVSLVRVTAERVKVMFVAADAYPKEAPAKGWL